MKIKIIILISFILLTSCIGGMGFAIKKEILPNYYLIAVDVIEDLELSYYETNDNDNHGTVVSATIVAFGFNEKYMIIKQKPLNVSFNQEFNTFYYYILPIKKGMNWRTKNNIIGPLNIEEFRKRQEELDIMDIKFKDIEKILNF